MDTDTQHGHGDGAEDADGAEETPIGNAAGDAGRRTGAGRWAVPAGAVVVLLVVLVGGLKWRSHAAAVKRLRAWDSEYEFVISVPASDPIRVEADGTPIDGPETLVYQKRPLSKTDEVLSTTEVTISDTADPSKQVTYKFGGESTVGLPVEGDTGELPNEGYQALKLVNALSQLGAGGSTQFVGTGMVTVALTPVGVGDSNREPISNALDIPIEVVTPGADGGRPSAAAGEGVEAKVNRARELKASGNLSEAADLLREAVAEDPAAVETHRVLAWVLIATKDSEGAKQQFQEVLDLDPQSEAGKEAQEALGRLD